MNNRYDGSTPDRAIPLPYEPTRIAPWARVMAEHPGLWFVYRTGFRAHGYDVERWIRKQLPGVETHVTLGPQGPVIVARMMPGDVPCKPS